MRVRINLSLGMGAQGPGKAFCFVKLWFCRLGNQLQEL